MRITQGSGTYVEDGAVDLVRGERTRHQQGLAQAGLRGSLVVLQAQTTRATAALAKALHDPMTQSLLASREQAQALFTAPARGELERIPLAQLEAANARLGLALAEDEIDYPVTYTHLTLPTKLLVYIPEASVPLKKNILRYIHTISHTCDNLVSARHILH